MVLTPHCNARRTLGGVVGFPGGGWPANPNPLNFTTLLLCCCWLLVRCSSDDRSIDSWGSLESLQVAHPALQTSCKVHFTRCHRPYPNPSPNVKGLVVEAASPEGVRGSWFWGAEQSMNGITNIKYFEKNIFLQTPRPPTIHGVQARQVTSPPPLNLWVTCTYYFTKWCVTWLSGESIHLVVATILRGTVGFSLDPKMKEEEGNMSTLPAM